MKKYKVWIHVEQIDESKDIYQDVGEPYSAGVFKSQSDAENFISDELLMAKTFAAKLRIIGEIGTKFLSTLPQTDVQNYSALKKLLDDALKTPSTPFDDRCPKCGASPDKREFIDREFPCNNVIHVHYKCTGCGSRITEEFTPGEIVLDTLTTAH
jgi:hypothetical protein